MFKVIKNLSNLNTDELTIYQGGIITTNPLSPVLQPLPKVAEAIGDTIRPPYNNYMIGRYGSKRPR